MRHDWQPYPKAIESKAEPYRRCANCGLVQQRRIRQLFGRCYYLWPMSEHCKPHPKI